MGREIEDEMLGQFYLDIYDEHPVAETKEQGFIMEDYFDDSPLPEKPLTVRKLSFTEQVKKALLESSGKKPLQQQQSPVPRLVVPSPRPAGTVSQSPSAGDSNISLIVLPNIGSLQYLVFRIYNHIYFIIYGM